MKIFSKLFIMLLMVLFSLSCQRDEENKYPSINFIGGENLISKNSVLKPNINFRVGINSFTNDKSKLYRFKVTRIYDNSPQVVLDSIIDLNIFNSAITFPTLNEENTERWIFEISCKNGYSSQISLLIKTNNSDSTSIVKNNVEQTNFILTDLPNKYIDLPIYFGMFVVLILGIIMFLIKRPRKIKEYNFVKIEQVNKLKEDIVEKINKQNINLLNIEGFINNKVDDYQKQIDNLKNNKIDKYSTKNIILYILIGLYAASLLIVMKIIG